MKKLSRFQLLFLVLLTGASLSGAWAQTAIDQIYDSRKQELANAYYQAGQRFIQLGDKARGDEFVAAAKKIYPAFDPSKSQTTPATPTTPGSPEVAPVLDAQGVPDRPQFTENLIQKDREKIVRLQFSKLLRGYLGQSADTIDSVLASKFTLGSGTDAQTFLASELTPKIDSFLQTNPPAAGSPDELFDLSSISLADAPEAGSGGVSLKVKAQADAPGNLAANLSFWQPNQVYTFVREGTVWKLASVSGSQ